MHDGLLRSAAVHIGPTAFLGAQVNSFGAQVAAARRMSDEGWRDR